MPRQVIAFTVSGLRQKYLRRALGSWAQARGVQDWHLVFALEPCRQFFPVDDFAGWVHRTFASAQVRVNGTRLGCLRNTRHAMRAAFASGAEFAVLAEEDCLVSDDVLEYFSWARDAYAGDRQAAAVCAHAKCAGAGGAADVVRSPWFSPVVWGTWRDRWEGFIDPAWGASAGNAESWDDHLRHVIYDAGRCSVFPVRSRSLHIGEVSTLTPGRLSGYFYRVALSSCFDARREPQDYREIPFTEDLGLLV